MFVKTFQYSYAIIQYRHAIAALCESLERAAARNNIPWNYYGSPSRKTNLISLEFPLITDPAPRVYRYASKSREPQINYDEGF